MPSKLQIPTIHGFSLPQSLASDPPNPLALDPSNPSGKSLLECWRQVEAGIIDFLAAIEPRLLLTSVPPAGDAAQPLTLAGLFELERVLFLLCHFARYAGSWHFALPGSLPKFRMALTSFLTFAAKADSIRPVTLECPPQSAQEKEMAAQPSGECG
ncbi:hypothetical protein DUNSADRAFT_1095 [Dunaliella salina]|uniref:Uncharacterized protein n=1 Tax=Dunaliella salina TaxID=3046 RepID=A0ABQ7GXI0_DUNSA|nr:hypothetical protein DUNSADRAFT_1095 [Dunaliella salina]|eukprot:KAF5839318.1 hypothetical protein DUNSADRAFT_1095 [Dunaliella salina]